MKKMLLGSALILAMVAPAMAEDATRTFTINWTISDSSDIARYTMYYSYKNDMSPKMVACETNDASVRSLTCANVEVSTFPVYFQMEAVTKSGVEHLTSPPRSVGIGVVQDFRVITIDASALTGFADNFSTNTIDEYTIVHTSTEGGAGEFLYDSSSQRASVLTGDNVGIEFSHTLSPTASGNFSLDFSPVQKYPAGGYLILRLSQDADNFYQIFSSDGYSAGSLKKFINGVLVDSILFSQGYVQNNTYNIHLDFSSDQTTVTAFGQSLKINSETSGINVSSFSFTLNQQDAYIDNINSN